MKKNSIKKILFIIFILFVIVYFFQLLRVARNYSQSYRFGDEDAHMVGGYFLLKGYRMYEDFSGNHQPLTYIFPAAVQRIFQPDTLYQFIGRHRQAIFGYSLIWNIIYLLTFGKFLFLFTAIFELTRYVLLGNKILGEPLAMYPLIFLFGVVIKKTIFNKQLPLKEIVLFSVSSFLATFSLAPVWPTIFLLNLLLFIAYRGKKKEQLWQIGPLIILTVILFSFVPLKDYLKQTVIDNLTYVIPKMNKVSSPLDYLRMVFLPLTGLHPAPNIIEGLSLGFIPLYAVMLYLVKKQKKLWPFLMIIAALISTNNRTVSLNYGNFHVLPWLASYSFIPIVFFSQYRKLVLPVIFLLTIMGFWLNIFGRTDYYGNLLFNLKNDLAAEHHVNYSSSVKYGLGIKAIKKKGDRLLAIPNDTLAFWVAEVDLATRPLESFRWQYDLPEYNRELKEVFKNRPPEFYLNHSMSVLRGNDPLEEFIINQLKEKYIRVNHLGKPSDLYILKSKLSIITQKQWDDFTYFQFDKPN